MLNITSHKQTGQKTTYNFQRAAEDQFYVGVDWEKSPGVRSGGYGLEFTDDALEVRGLGGDDQWDILVAPKNYENSVMVLPARSEGLRGGGMSTPPVSQIDFPNDIAPEQNRKVALQVASAVIGIPLLESMLQLEAPKG